MNMRAMSWALVLVGASLVLSADAYSACQKAYSHCEFKFSGEAGLSTYNIQPDLNDQAFTPIIVSKDPRERIGVLNMNGITPEFIFPTGSVSPITDFGSQPFTETHFKPFWKSDEFGSGIGHQTFHSDQAHVAKGKCIRIYFTSFQVLKNENGYHVVVDNRNNVPKWENKCVVFETNRH